MNVLRKLELIKDGWKGIIFLSPTVEKLAEERAKICATCPFAEENSFLQAMGKILKRVTGLKCSRCGCPISAKVRSISEVCPHPDGAKW